MRDAYSATQSQERDKYFSGFQIASPLNKLPLGHFDYATHDKDRLINTLRFLLGALESNLDTPLVVNNAYESFGDYLIDFVLNHGITSTYLYDSDIKPQVIKKMISTGQLLESNCANSIINYTKTALKVSFDSTDPSDPLISGLTYIWDFGDNVIKKTQEKTINHLYEEPGTYTVKLKVLDEYENVFVSERNVTVKLPYVLSPLFEINKSNKTAEFTATNYYEEVSYVWNFGDGQVEEAIGQTITHNYAEEGIYDVTLTVVAPNGNQKSLTKKMIIADERIYDYKRLGQYADFKVRPAFDLSGTGLFFQWEFGEGQTLKTQDLNVQHIYSDLFGKSVTLKIVNEFDKVIYKNNVQLDDQSNTELFTYKLSGRDISIEIFSQYSVSGTQNYYFWNFDNDTTLTSHEQKIDFSFPDLLAKEITLQIKDKAGIILYQSKVSLLDRSSANLFYQIANRNAKLTLISSIGGSPSDFTYFWEYGDGKSEENNLDTVIHKYDAEGSYTATVSVFDKNGKFLFAKSTYIIQDMSMASFGGAPLSGEGAMTVSEYWESLLPHLRSTTVSGFSYETNVSWLGTCYVKGVDYFYYNSVTQTYGSGTKYVYMPLYNCTAFDEQYSVLGYE